MATHSSILAWRIPWRAVPGGQLPWGHKESDMAEHACIKCNNVRYCPYMLVSIFNSFFFLFHISFYFFHKYHAMLNYWSLKCFHIH